MWSGATPTVYRNGVNQATMFVCKSKLDELLFDKREGDGKKLAVWQSMSGGFLATCPGIILTNPFDMCVSLLVLCGEEKKVLDWFPQDPCPKALARQGRGLI